jgi:hypothetical protein
MPNWSADLLERGRPRQVGLPRPLSLPFPPSPSFSFPPSPPLSLPRSLPFPRSLSLSFLSFSLSLPLSSPHSALDLSRGPRCAPAHCLRHHRVPRAGRSRHAMRDGAPRGSAYHAARNGERAGRRQRRRTGRRAGADRMLTAERNQRILRRTPSVTPQARRSESVSVDSATRSGVEAAGRRGPPGQDPLRQDPLYGGRQLGGSSRGSPRPPSSPARNLGPILGPAIDSEATVP